MFLCWGRAPDPPGSVIRHESSQAPAEPHAGMSDCGAADMAQGRVGSDRGFAGPAWEPDALPGAPPSESPSVHSVVPTCGKWL